MNVKKPILLCILDGWGIASEDDQKNGNPIELANLPNYNRILKEYPSSKLETSGSFVGLPEGQIGNSEVGHMTIGAGRTIFQNLPRINSSIKDGSLVNIDSIKILIKNLQESKKPCHLLGLLSDGGVHSYINHIIFIANHLVENGIEVFLHAFLDGRDVGQKSAIKYLDKFKREAKNVKIATISGRYYAMDRDNKWDRTNLTSDAIIKAKGLSFVDEAKLIEENYKNNITDEFIKPSVNSNFKGFDEESALIFCNFRSDRARQISAAIRDSGIKISNALSMTKYSEELSNFYKVIFESIDIKNSLPEILANNNLSQLRVAETEKYAHVTFFFSCGREKEFKNEKRVLLQSPDVATYDLKPEMSSDDIGKKLLEAIGSEKFDFIVVNYANPDMVGHSGNLEASIKACKVIDYQIKILEEKILEKNGVMLISADHGNIECMIDGENQPHTAHTTNPVPFIFIAKNLGNATISDGSLSDIAPTVLNLLNIEKPSEMTGKNLINLS